MNRLYFGDNLKWLSDRKEFPNASVDLVYLDPPFNSNADYNVLFREPSGQVSQAQFHAFTDTWSWADAADTYHQFIDACPNVAVVELMEALHSFLKHSPMMAYLAMMAPRLVSTSTPCSRGPLRKLPSSADSCRSFCAWKVKRRFFASSQVASRAKGVRNRRALSKPPASENDAGKQAAPSRKRADRTRSSPVADLQPALAEDFNGPHEAVARIRRR
jgi:hypothetical protein